MPKVTMQKIADELNISKVSVSKAINGQEGVSDELRRNILDLAEHCGYVPLKRVIPTHPMVFLCLAAKRFFLDTEQFYNTIYFYISRFCKYKDIETRLHIITSREETSLDSLNTIITDDIDGIFMLGEISNEYYTALSNCRKPLVGIDFYKAPIKSDFVAVDNFYTTFNLVNMLVKYGYKNIGFIGDPTSTNSISDRYHGYLKALEINFVPFDSKFHIKTLFGDVSPDILPDELPEIYICHCDFEAYTLITNLRIKGFNIPDDVSVISFDNTKLSDTSNPTITTIDVNKELLAKKAVSKLIKRIENPNSPFTRSLIDGELILKQSTKLFI